MKNRALLCWKACYEERRQNPLTAKEAIIALDALLTLLLPNSQPHCARPNEDSSESEAAPSDDEAEGEKMEVDEDEFWKSDSDDEMQV